MKMFPAAGFILALTLLGAVHAAPEIKTAAPPPQQAQEAQASAQVDRPTALVGDPIRLTLRVTVPRETEVKTLTGLNDIGGLHVKNFTTAQDKSAPGGRVVKETVYVLEGFVTGSFIIPPLRVLYRAKDAAQFREMQTGEIFVEIRSVDQGKPDASGDIYDIKPPAALFHVPGWVVALGLVMFVAALGWAAWRRHTGTEKIPEAQVVRPPHEEALEELRRIRDLGLVAAGKYKEFYYLVSQTLRRYIERRFCIPVTEKTTEEFIADMARGSVISEGHRELIQNYLAECDKVKFAKHLPGQEEIAATYRTAEEFILATQPEEQQPEGAGQA